MIDLKLEIDDVINEFEIPESWEDLSVGKYMDFRNIKLKNIDGSERDVDDLFKEIVSIFIGLDIDDIELLLWEDYVNLINLLEFVNTPLPDVKLKESIEIDGEVYYLKKNFDKLTNGERISISVIKSKYGNKLDKCMDELMCIFLRKKKENGKLESYKTTMKSRMPIFRKVSIMDVHNLFVFFSTGSNG